MPRWSEQQLRDFERRHRKPDTGLQKPPVLVSQPSTKSFEVRQSTDEAKLNKTERDYLQWLRAMDHVWIGVQNITLKLADDTRYTPDFWVVDDQGFRALEIKGFWRDDAKVKIKVAARLFPMIRFVVVTREGGVWQHSEVKC